MLFALLVSVMVRLAQALQVEWIHEQRPIATVRRLMIGNVSCLGYTFTGAENAKRLALQME